ncbi:MAG: hypothetical protein E7340_01670 [Clostridiales bacterium]|nr:hypothetical protein [Clostridiales bacterium]
MNEFIISFSLGMFGVLILFFISLVIVFLAKLLILTIKKNTAKNPVVQEAPPQKPAQPKREKPPKSPPVIRTIEIDPSQVDRIYVKKAQ